MVTASACSLSSSRTCVRICAKCHCTDACSMRDISPSSRGTNGCRRSGRDRQTFSSASLARMRTTSSALKVHCTSSSSRSGRRDAASITMPTLRRPRGLPPVSSAAIAPLSSPGRSWGTTSRLSASIRVHHPQRQAVRAQPVPPEPNVPISSAGGRRRAAPAVPECGEAKTGTAVSGAPGGCAGVAGVAADTAHPAVPVADADAVAAAVLGHMPSRWTAGRRPGSQQRLPGRLPPASSAHLGVRRVGSHRVPSPATLGLPVSPFL